MSQHFHIYKRMIGSLPLWHVDHVPSGLSALPFRDSGFARKRDAKAWAQALARLVPKRIICREDAGQHINKDAVQIMWRRMNGGRCPRSNWWRIKDRYLARRAA